MTPRTRRVRWLALASAFVLTTTSCTGFLRSISSDNAVDWEQTATEYRFESRDLTLQLPGQWRSVHPDDELAGAYEYDTTMAQDQVSIRLWAKAGRTRVVNCGRELTQTLTAAGWKLERDLDEDLAGLRGVGFAGSRDGRYQHAWCVASNQSARVLVIIQVPHTPDAAERIDSLVAGALSWKA